MTLSKYMSKVIDDGKIEVAEFDMICKFIEDFCYQKSELRRRKVDTEM